MEVKQKSLAEYVDEIVRCSICYDDVKDPKSLSCLHTFCFNCIVKHYESSSTEGKCRCPQCRKETQIPVGGVGKLPSNFIVRGLLEFKSQFRCDECGLSKTENHQCGYCIQCGVNVCQECATRSHPNHQLGPVGNGTVNCPVHKDKKLVDFCRQCFQNLCSACPLSEHRGHRSNDDNANSSSVLRQGLEVDLEQLAKLFEDVKAEERKSVRRNADFRTRLDRSRDIVNVGVVLDSKQRASEIFDGVMCRQIYGEDDLTVFNDRLQSVLAQAQSFVKTVKRRLQSCKQRDIKQIYREFHPRAEVIMKEADKIKQNIAENVALEDIQSLMLRSVEGFYKILNCY